jgi:hypothetical protein
MLVMALVIVVLGTTVAASTGVWEKRDFRMPAAAAARRAAGLLAMGGCVLYVSPGGRLTTDQTFSSLVLLAPSLATRGRAVGRDYAQWLQMPDRIRTWYIEANGREPSSEDIGHYLFQWREERSRPEDIRRRIFGAAKKPLPQGP